MSAFEFKDLPDEPGHCRVFLDGNYLGKLVRMPSGWRCLDKNDRFIGGELAVYNTKEAAAMALVHSPPPLAGSPAR
jgi:hypothetical protein